MIKLENKNRIRYFLNLNITSDMQFYLNSKIYLKYNHQGQNQIRLYLKNNRVHHVKVNDVIILNKSEKSRYILFNSDLLNNKSENLIEVFMSGKIKQRHFIKPMKQLIEKNKVKYILKSQVTDEFIPQLNIPKLISKHKIKIKIPSDIKACYNIKPYYKHLIKGFIFLYFETNSIYPFIKEKTELKLLFFKNFHFTHHNFSSSR